MLSGCMRDMSFLICRGRLHHAHLWQKPGTLEHEKEMNTPSCFGEALFSPPLSLLPSLSLSLSLSLVLARFCMDGLQQSRPNVYLPEHSHRHSPQSHKGTQGQHRTEPTYLTRMPAQNMSKPLSYFETNIGALYVIIVSSYALFSSFDCLCSAPLTLN